MGVNILIWGYSEVSVTASYSGKPIFALPFFSSDAIIAILAASCRYFYGGIPDEDLEHFADHTDCADRHPGCPVLLRAEAAEAAGGAADPDGGGETDGFDSGD